MKLSHITTGEASDLAGHRHKGVLPSIRTELPGFDGALGGSIPIGSVVLLAGEPGSGKSTLAMQIALACIDQGMEVLYHAGEQAPSEVALLADRLMSGWPDCVGQLSVSCGTQLPETLRYDYDLVIVDSIQCMADPGHSSTPGSVTQLRLATDMIVGQAKSTLTPMILVGHFTKAGGVSGPRAMEHSVDAVMTLKTEGGYRMLTVKKNRMGPADTTVAYTMTSTGLQPVVGLAPTTYRLPPRTRALLAVLYPAVFTAAYMTEPVQGGSNMGAAVLVVLMIALVHWWCRRFAAATHQERQHVQRTAQMMAIRRLIR